jgi:hypothetical protein
MPEVNGVSLPAFGTLAEIHKALLERFDFCERECIINGIGWTVVPDGFRSNRTEKVYTCENLERFPPGGLGTCLLLGFIDVLPEEVAEIITTMNIPHISKRCPICGDQLNQYEIEHYGACFSCYSEETGH